VGKRYTSFAAVEADWRIRLVPKRIQKKALRRVGIYLRQWIRAQHGSTSLKANTPLTIALKGGNSPLKHTGLLKKAVSFKTSSSAVIIYSKEPYLQSIHEFGRRWKMSDAQRGFLFAMIKKFGIGAKRGRPRTTSKGMIVIPPRPIWRTAIEENLLEITRIIQSTINEVI
jgi:phage gpG-like protein